MISLVGVAVAGARELVLTFSDGSYGTWSADEVITRDTVLTRPLADPSYLARAFIESGEGLAWPNGLEFSAMGLQRGLRDSGKLIMRAA